MKTFTKYVQATRASDLVTLNGSLAKGRTTTVDFSKLMLLAYSRARQLRSYGTLPATSSLRRTALPRRWCHPRIDRMEMRTAEMGRIATRLLIDRITGRAHGGAMTIKVTPEYLPAGPRIPKSVEAQ